MSEDRGTRIGNETLAFIPADHTIRPLRDQIIVEPLPHNDILEIPGWRTIRGKVLAVGPGTYPKLYNGPKGKRSKSWDSKQFRRTEVKVGDIVHLGGKEIRGYLFPTVRWGAREVVVCREADVAVIQ
jgi:co-chaperonin GroES (HSP10)